MFKYADDDTEKVIEERFKPYKGDVQMLGQKWMRYTQYRFKPYKGDVQIQILTLTSSGSVAVSNPIRAMFK